MSSARLPLLAAAILVVLLVGAPAGAQNIALAKPTAQSSTYVDSYAGAESSDRAVDGNTSGNYLNKSITHTNYENNPWWMVDLGATYDISQIRVWNRTDCCADRLFPFRIAIQDVFDAAVNGAAAWWADVTVDDGSNPIVFAPNAQGRFVKVQLTATDYLTLAEVEVDGTVVTATPEPGSASLLLIGLFGLAGTLSRKRAA